MPWSSGDSLNSANLNNWGGNVSNIRGYGAAGDGSTDDTAAIAAAVAAGASVVVFPAGTYLVSGLSLSQNSQTWELQDGATVRLADSSDTGLLDISGNKCLLRGGKFDANRAGQTTASSGIAVSSIDVHLEGVEVINAGNQNIETAVTAARLLVKDCIVSGAARNIALVNSDDHSVVGCYVTGSTGTSNSFDANIYIASAERATIRDCFITSSARDGIYADSSNDLLVAGSRISANGTLALDIGRGITLATNCTRARILGNSVTSNVENGIYVGSASNTQKCVIANNASVNNNQGDVAGGHGIELNGPFSIVYGNYCEGNNAGISVNGDDCSVVGNTCVSNVSSAIALFGNGIKVYNASRVKILGNTCVDNTAAGIDLNADAGEGNALVVGNLCEGNNIGIALSSDYSYNVVAYNEVGGNTTKAINTSATTTRFSGNRGYATENSGTATILNTSTSTAVTHSLDVTPIAGDILVTPIETLNNASFFWVDTLTSTQFTINVNADPGQDVDFAWKAGQL